MTRPKGSSYRSNRLIFEALVDGPKSVSQIVGCTKLHPSTVTNRLRDLVHTELLERERNGHYIMHYIDQTNSENPAFVKEWAMRIDSPENRIKSIARVFFQLNQHKIIHTWTPIGFFSYKMRLHKIDLTANYIATFLQRAKKAGIILDATHLIKHHYDPFCPKCIALGRLESSKTIVSDKEYYYCLSCGFEFTVEDLTDYEVKGHILLEL